jgi:hypothetical protein
MPRTVTIRLEDDQLESLFGIDAHTKFREYIDLSSTILSAIVDAVRSDMAYELAHPSCHCGAVLDLSLHAGPVNVANKRHTLKRCITVDHPAGRDLCSPATCTCGDDTDPLFIHRYNGSPCRHLDRVDL